jgi:hypothetical protein
MRESALQKVMGHKDMSMTMLYARILDQTLETSFGQAVDRMREESRPGMPNFFQTEEAAVFSEEDSINWIRLGHGYCRRNSQLRCESDVKCLLCERFAATLGDLPMLTEMKERFLKLGMTEKANVTSNQIRKLERPNVKVACDLSHRVFQ